MRAQHSSQHSAEAARGAWRGARRAAPRAHVRPPHRAARPPRRRCGRPHRGPAQTPPPPCSAHGAAGTPPIRGTQSRNTSSDGCTATHTHTHSCACMGRGGAQCARTSSARSRAARAARARSASLTCCCAVRIARAACAARRLASPPSGDVLGTPSPDCGGVALPGGGDDSGTLFSSPCDDEMALAGESAAAAATGACSRCC